MIIEAVEELQVGHIGHAAQVGQGTIDTIQHCHGAASFQTHDFGQVVVQNTIQRSQGGTVGHVERGQVIAIAIQTGEQRIIVNPDLTQVGQFGERECDEFVVRADEGLQIVHVPQLIKAGQLSAEFPSP